MENIFYNDEFCSGPEDLLYYLDIDEESYDELPEDWSIQVEHTTEEKIFVLDLPFVTNAIFNATDYYEDRFPEDSERVIKEIEKAITESVNMEKLNSLLPTLCYPNGKKSTITKQDLGDLCGFKKSEVQ